ncbi:stage II sporulation protein E [Sporolactobacillus sp. CQH2019]|uniref:stage II sporulation protein E n=1 Tax=Sporolactobacillus sp. CQH2019 TaxID=3023512 RepID=UPI002367FEBC|nr:stage II sporulation protein E [Sporolactobacillus sp. CQH2019]MDD9150704.1 stage II sporulation protein E [Sporolactobacillus sp. CQH2019]
MAQRIGSSAAGTIGAYGREGRPSRRQKGGGVIKAVRAFIVKALSRIDFVYLVTGFLLGRAVILSSLTPFVLPFFAMVFWLKREKRWLVSFAALAGSLTVSVGQAFYALMALLVFLGLRRMILSLSRKAEEKWLPVLVLTSGFSVRLICKAAFSLNLVWTDVMTAAAEAFLAFLVTLIFMQSVPFLSTKINRKLLKNEEIICFVILLSSILSGMIGWTVMGISVNYVFARYAVLLFSYAGGAAIGSTVGVVIGLILGMGNVSSLYQMSLLAFSGVLGGLLKEAGRAGVSAGLLIATLLIGLYGDGYAGLSGAVLDSLAAIALFFLTPGFVTERLASFIPGTREYQKEQQQYIRKLRDATVSRVEQFSSLFQTLARSFYPPAEQESREEDLFLSKVAARTCQNCFKKEHCWVKNYDETRRLMLQFREASRGGRKPNNPKLRRAWREHCVKSEKTIEAISIEQIFAEEQARMKRTVKESRRLVADQLSGVSQVMGDFAIEMKRERGLHEWQEEMILMNLNGAGIHVESVEIYSLEAGAVDIEVVLPSDHYEACEKVIAPLLSDILRENICVEKKQTADLPGGPSRAVFASARAYEIEAGVATAARGGGFVSGDNYSLFEIASGKYALAISDGMGNGERAGMESRDTLQLLTKVLNSGIHEKLAIKSINSILSLRSTEEIFATLDLALIDLQDAKSTFLKIGSNPSFIKRGNGVIMLDAANLPMGMIENFEVEVKTEQLKSGDLLIMMSDGIFDAPRQIENKEAWVRRKIREMQTDDPQAIADLILEEVIRMGDGRIEDDMTVIAARIQHHMPKWSSISAGIKEKELRRAE